MRQCVWALCLSLTWLGVLAGCGVSKGVVKRAARAAKVSNGKLSLQVTISPNANQNSPVAVDVLLINDKAFLKAVQGLSASDWFTKKAQLQLQYPKSAEISSWEWVPDQKVQPLSIDVPVNAQAAMMFANYASAGPHSAVLPIKGKVNVLLEDDDFTIGNNKK